MMVFQRVIIAGVHAQLLAVALMITSAGAQTASSPGYAWESRNLGVALTNLPSGWVAESSTERELRLVKQFEQDGLRFRERITLEISGDTYGHIESTIKELSKEGFSLVENERLNLGQLSVPFWFMSRQGDPEESGWVALVLHAGKGYVLDLRSTPLDADALRDFGTVIEGFRFIADPREEAWSALMSGDAVRAARDFKQILNSTSADANARYGLGLSELAEGDTKNAIRDLERVAPVLGMDEDVRRALGQAEFDAGHMSRAVALWTQVLRDDSAWDSELRPWIMQAIRAAELRPDVKASGSKRTLSNHLTVLAVEMLSLLRRGDEGVLYELKSEFEKSYGQLLSGCLANKCAAADLAFLLAGYDIEGAMRLAMTGVHTHDEAKIEESQLRIARGFKELVRTAR